jgi:hypothetical protein
MLVMLLPTLDTDQVVGFEQRAPRIAWHRSRGYLKLIKNILDGFACPAPRRSFNLLTAVRAAFRLLRPMGCTTYRDHHSSQHSTTWASVCHVACMHETRLVLALSGHGRALVVSRVCNQALRGDRNEQTCAHVTQAHTHQQHVQHTSRTATYMYPEHSTNTTSMQR